MQGLNRLQIVNHKQIAHRVTVTEYENGTRVYVNYSNADYAEGEITVPARSYIVAGRDQ